MSRRIATLVSVACIALPAAAQIGNPAGMQPSTPQSQPGQPAPGQPNTQDRLFVHLAGTGNMAEVQAGQLAQANARNAEVKRFAQQMVQDHQAAIEQLGGLARRASIPMPADITPEQRAMLQRLQSADAAAFDLEYLRGQLVEHQKTVQLLHWHLSTGQEGDMLRASAAQLAAVLNHLETAQTLFAQLSGTAPQGLAAAAWKPPR